MSFARGKLLIPLPSCPYLAITNIGFFFRPVRATINMLASHQQTDNPTEISNQPNRLGNLYQSKLSWNERRGIVLTVEKAKVY